MPQRVNPAAPLLTARERECLALVGQGLSPQEIGARLFVSPATVNFHLCGAREKLSCASSGSAYVAAVRRGEIPCVCKLLTQAEIADAAAPVLAEIDRGLSALDAKRDELLALRQRLLLV